MSEISERLKEARVKSGLSTTKVSKITKISEGNLSELEKGVYKPSSDTLLRLSEAYSISIDWLLKGKTSLFEENDDNKEIVSFLRMVYKEWENCDSVNRSWIIVQLRRSFPEIAEKLEKELNSEY